MAEKDFNAYMTGECVPANTWESALMICEVIFMIVYIKDINNYIISTIMEIIYFYYRVCILCLKI